MYHEAWRATTFQKTNGNFADVEGNLQNEEASSRSQGRRLAKHTSLEQPRHQGAPLPPAPSDWATLKLQMQKLQVHLQPMQHKELYL